MTDRIPLDNLTDDDLDRLYTERDQLLAELDGRDDEARERWIQNQINETGIRSMDFRNGMTMELEPARELIPHWVAAARTLLGDAPNYTETPVEMEFKTAESPERFAFIVQRVGKITPHQARQQAEAERDLLRAFVDVVALELDNWHPTASPELLRAELNALATAQQPPAATSCQPRSNP
ncbi:hypothetical protein [Streptomyces syringium]|uniref:hypothetical protein n=1 Tax=Streptomyces syringium TaxID=76729 RepID=UPI0033DB8385